MNVTHEEMLAVIESAGVSADIASIKGDTPLSKSGIDSLEIMNVFLAIEEKYGIKISDEDIDALLTVNDVIAYFKRV